MEWFPQTALDGSGNATVTLTNSPRAGTRIMAMVAQSRRAAHVTTVSGTSITVLVVFLRMPAHTPAGTNSAPTFTGSALGTHLHGLTQNADVLRHVGIVTLNNCTSVACDGNSLEGAGIGKVAGPGAVSDVAAASAGTPAGTVTAPTFTGSAVGPTNNEAAASETVDLCIAYEVA